MRRSSATWPRSSADKQHKIKAVLVCQNETATGVTSDVAAIRQAMDSVKHPGAAVRRLGERAGQHRLPHGRVGRRCLRQRLAEGPDAARRPRRHLREPEGARSGQDRDLAALLFRLRRHGATPTPRATFPYTPSMPMLYGLRESLAMLAEEGLENVFHRHTYLAGGVRAAVLDGWKLKLCATAPKWYSDTVSAVMVPEGINGAEVIARAFKRYNLALGAGLSKVAGKLFRIGHLGDLNELMLLGAHRGRRDGHARCRRQDRARQRRRRRAELLARAIRRCARSKPRAAAKTGIAA